MNHGCGNINNIGGQSEEHTWLSEQKQDVITNNSRPKPTDANMNTVKKQEKQHGKERKHVQTGSGVGKFTYTVSTPLPTPII